MATKMNSKTGQHEMDVGALEKKARWVRREAIEMCLAAGGGHVAPAFSCTDILVALYYGGIMKVDPKNRFWPDRDRFILSKGQGCASLYAVLADFGFFPVKDLRTYCQLGTHLGGHSESNVPGVEAFTGSLGQGIALGAGMALAAKVDGKKYFTYVILGDGELQEGSVWEAAMFAGHHHLDNLVAIIDRNGLQAIDFTEQAMMLEPLADKWQSFGWDVEVVNGHDYTEMLEVFGKARTRDSDKPLCVIANTIKGKGVSFMENKAIWHFRIPTGDEIAQARKELEQ